MNAYTAMQEIRQNLDEPTAAHWSDVEILRKMNGIHRRIAMIFADSDGEWLLTSSDLTPSSSVITLPSDFGRAVYMEEKSSGRVISLDAGIRERRLTRPSGADLWSGALEAYLVGDTLEVNKDSYGEEVTLWYQKRVPDLHTGTGGASSGATALQFESGNQPRRQTNYYNNLYVEAMGGTGAGTRAQITAFNASTLVATTDSGTFSSDTEYGTESLLPDEIWEALILQTTVLCLAKPGAALDPQYFQFFKTEAVAAWKTLESYIDTRRQTSERVRVTEIL